MILPIYIYGQPCLRKVSEDITLDYPELTQLVDNMWETLASSEGIGLAAPQIGKNIRLVVIDLDLISEDFPEYKDFKKVFINPHILEYDEESPKDNLEKAASRCLVSTRKCSAPPVFMPNGWSSTARSTTNGSTAIWPV